MICDACNVREPWEHRCYGEGCTCGDLMCRSQRGDDVAAELDAAWGALETDLPGTWAGSDFTGGIDEVRP